MDLGAALSTVLGFAFVIALVQQFAYLLRVAFPSPKRRGGVGSGAGLPGAIDARLAAAHTAGMSGGMNGEAGDDDRSRHDIAP